MEYGPKAVQAQSFQFPLFKQRGNRGDLKSGCGAKSPQPPLLQRGEVNAYAPRKSFRVARVPLA